MADWTDYGPAEFDRRRMPRGRKPQNVQQAGLFVLAAEPLPAKTAGPGPEMDGQADLFGNEDVSGVIGANGLVYSDADPGL
jgi:hypothetical protein